MDRAARLAQVFNEGGNGVSAKNNGKDAQTLSALLWTRSHPIEAQP